MDVIRIKKKDVKKILSLYTMNGLTQKEVGQAVFRSDEMKGVSTYAIVQRVLHYFGLNMEYRRDYKHDGLTEDIIDLILDNRILAFPLAIPTDGKCNPIINFDVELNKLLDRNNKKWNLIGHLKNFLVVALLIVLTYFSLINYSKKMYRVIGTLLFLGLSAFEVTITGVDEKGLENTGIGDFIKMIILFVYILVMFSIGLYRS